MDRKDEFGELSRAFFALSQERRNAENSLVALTRADPLTGSLNRRMFKEVFGTAIVQARRNHQQIALAYLDIDHFKTINDTYGHGVGDLVLVEYASRLKAAVRSTDAVARLAGELVVVFENLAGDAKAAELAHKILGSTQPELILVELALTITTRMGVAVNPNGSAKMAKIKESSDQALYEAKSAGRNGYAARRLPGAD